MDLEKMKADLKKLAVRDQLGEMLELMQEDISLWNGLYAETDFLQWQGQLHHLEREEKLGIISPQEYTLQRNKLRHFLIEVAMQAGKSPVPSMSSEGDELLDKAEILIQDREYREAETLLLRARQIGLQQRPQHVLHALLGHVYQEQNRWNEAIAEQQKALEEAPEAGNYWTNLGISYRNTGQYDKAEACYEKALAINPDYSNVHASLGALHLTHTMDFTSAIKHLESAIDLDPGSAIAHANMALAQASVGQFELAETYLQKAVMKGYRNAKNCRAMIDNLRATR
jgi:tetratricopeptide (TPR) repeat protein